MRLKRKGAIELSMTTIVVIIIAIVLLSLGLVFVRGMFAKIGELSDQAFLQAEKEIEDKMRGDQKVYIGGTTFDVGVGKSQTVSAGIQNLEGTPLSFKLQATSPTTNRAGLTVNVNDWFLFTPAKTVPAGEKSPMPFVISVPKTAKAGDIVIVNIEAYAGNALYGSESIIINVG